MERKRVKISRLNRGDQFEYNGQKYTVSTTVVGFGTTVTAKSLKNGSIVSINKNQEVIVE